MIASLWLDKGLSKGLGIKSWTQVLNMALITTFNHCRNHAFIGVLYTQEIFSFNFREMISSVRLTVCIDDYDILFTAIYSDLMKIWQSKMMRTSSCMLWVFGYLVVSLHGFSHSGFGVERFMRINDENAITYPSTNVNHCIGLFLTFCKTVSKTTNQNDLILLVAFIILRRPLTVVENSNKIWFLEAKLHWVFCQ